MVNRSLLKQFSSMGFPYMGMGMMVLVLLFFMNIGYAQERYVDVIFSKIKVDTYTYSDTLKLDFYHSNRDTVTNKPLLLLVHGGGFGSGKRNNILETNFCHVMAQKGYAVASMGYRLTRKGKGFGCKAPTGEKMDTFLATSEDILKASQFLVDQSASLQWDPKKVILVGSSAGAEAVLNTAFMKNQYQFKELPYGTVGFSGVVSFSGAVLNANYITKDTALPTLLFHGEKDHLVPFAQAPHHYCDEIAPGFIMLDGSQTIAEQLEALGTSYTIVVDPEGNHDWANLAYGYTDIISSFIKKAILDKERIQSKIIITIKKQP